MCRCYLDPRSRTFLLDSVHRSNLLLQFGSSLVSANTFSISVFRNICLEQYSSLLAKCCIVNAVLLYCYVLSVNDDLSVGGPVVTQVENHSK